WSRRKHAAGCERKSVTSQSKHANAEPQADGTGAAPGEPSGFRWSAGMAANGAPIAPCPREGLLTEPIAAAQPPSPERVLMPDCVENLFSRIESEILIRQRPGIRNKRLNLIRLRNNNTRIGSLLSGHRLFQHNPPKGVVPARRLTAALVKRLQTEPQFP